MENVRPVSLNLMDQAIQDMSDEVTTATAKLSSNSSSLAAEMRSSPQECLNINHYEYS